MSKIIELLTSPINGVSFICGILVGIMLGIVIGFLILCLKK